MKRNKYPKRLVYMHYRCIWSTITINSSFISFKRRLVLRASSPSEYAYTYPSGKLDTGIFLNIFIYFFEKIMELLYVSGWFPNLMRAYDNNGRCPRQKFVFGILQLFFIYIRNDVVYYSLSKDMTSCINRKTTSCISATLSS